jgi:hypothetical protein
MQDRRKNNRTFVQSWERRFASGLFAVSHGFMAVLITNQPALDAFHAEICSFCARITKFGGVKSTTSFNLVVAS